MRNKYDKIARKLGLEFVDSYPERTEAQLVQIEERLGQALPADYRVFVAKYGLTMAVDLVFPEYQSPNKLGGGIDVFYGIGVDDQYDLIDEWESMKEVLPEQFLPIADIPGGLLCLSLRTKDYGSVYWWAAEDTRSGSKVCGLVNPEFDAFMKSLKIEEE